MRKSLLSMSMLLCFSAIVLAGVTPSGYYDDATGKSGLTLKMTLHDIIDGHSSVSYTPGVWNAFATTDVKADGSVWDMYSDVPSGTTSYNYTFISDQCGSSGYQGEGDCFNREHTFPQSWFSKASPMVTDLFHVVASDGYVNGKRSNNPYGEVDSPTWTSTNGCKLGASVTAGYSGTVFEPIDEYKGDFARGYFYMATRYYGEDSAWPGSDMVDGAEPKTWALAMLLRWHASDPVSDKETDRNNAIHDIQGNRNPFIDHPEYVSLIWGTDTTSTDPGDTTVTSPSGVVTEITLETSDYALIIDYVNDSGLPNTSTLSTIEYYYGASSQYTNFDTRTGKQNASFASPEEAIEDAIIKVILPAKAPEATLYDGFKVNYATYDGSKGTGAMDFYCSSTSPLTFVRGLVTSQRKELIQSCVLYPNPTSSSFALSTDASSVVVLSLSGQVLLHRGTLLAQESIDVSALEQGLYLVRISFGKQIQLSKLILE